MYIVHIIGTTDLWVKCDTYKQAIERVRDELANELVQAVEILDSLDLVAL